MKRFILTMLLFFKHPIYCITRKIIVKKYANFGHVRIKIFDKSKICIGSVHFRNYGEIRVSEKSKLVIGENVFINNNINITCVKSITIGSNCKIGCNVTIVDHDHDYKNNINDLISSDIEIGNNVWIGSNVVICKGVKIGDNVVIGAGSVVLKDIPSNKVFVQKKEAVIYEKNDIY